MDPLAPDYPWYTPYQFAGNSPIRNTDLDGLEEKSAIEKAWDFLDGFGGGMVRAFMDAAKSFDEHMAKVAKLMPVQLRVTGLRPGDPTPEEMFSNFEEAFFGGRGALRPELWEEYAEEMSQYGVNMKLLLQRAIDGDPDAIGYVFGVSATMLLVKSGPRGKALRRSFNKFRKGASRELGLIDPGPITRKGLQKSKEIHDKSRRLRENKGCILCEEERRGVIGAGPGPNFKRLSNSRASKIAKALGYKDEHDFKINNAPSGPPKWWDMIMDNKTGQMGLRRIKDGKEVPLNIFYKK